MEISGIEITHPDKLMFPGSKVTKGDIAEYYSKVAKLMVPFLKGRPVTLVRSPEGVDKGVFYQRHPGEYFPDYIGRVKIRANEEVETYITVDSEEDLVYLANQGVIEFHAWGSKSKDEDRPDMVIWDLDPSPEVEWKWVVDAALIINEVLTKLKLKTFVKVSGSKGIHVYIPIQPKHDWDTVKQFSLEIAEFLVGKDPEHYTTEVRKENRVGKIFIDYLRNNKGGTAVSPFSLRAKSKPAISLPIRWSDVDYKLEPNGFLIGDTKLTASHPWQDFFETKQDLPL